MGYLQQVYILQLKLLDKIFTSDADSYRNIITTNIPIKSKYIDKSCNQILVPIFLVKLYESTVFAILMN